MRFGQDPGLKALYRRGAAFAAAFVGAVLLAATVQPPSAQALEMQSPASCAVGMRVSTRDGHTGTITRVDRAWSYCYVRQDDTGREVGYLYSLLDTAGGGGGGGGGARGAPQLAVGVYECMGNGTLLGPRVRITGPRTYSIGNNAGQYRIESSGKIVFESGPLKPYFSKLLSNGRIGLNSNGDSFYATACDLNRNLR